RRFGRAKAEAAVAFGHADAGQAELGELLPQIVAEPVRAPDLAPVPQLLRDAPFFGKEARRRLLQHLLIVGQQAHATFSSLAPSGERAGERGRPSLSAIKVSTPSSFLPTSALVKRIT